VEEVAVEAVEASFSTSRRTPFALLHCHPLEDHHLRKELLRPLHLR